jgi:hypothetical protein
MVRKVERSGCQAVGFSGNTVEPSVPLFIEAALLAVTSVTSGKNKSRYKSRNDYESRLICPSNPWAVPMKNWIPRLASSVSTLAGAAAAPSELAGGKVNDV